MFSPKSKLPRMTESVRIRLSDRFMRTEVNVICPVMKAENSVRVLYKLQRKLLEDVLRRVGESNALQFESVSWKPGADSRGIGGNVFINYSAPQKMDLQNFKNLLESQLAEVLAGRHVLIDECEDIILQPVISEADYELHKIKLCVQEILKEDRPEVEPLAESIKEDLDELRESYTRFAVLSHNGKGKSFILNVLFLMTADNQEEYAQNNRDIQLPKGFPNNISWGKLRNANPTDLQNFPDVVKDVIKDKNEKFTKPFCNSLQYSGVKDVIKDKNEKFTKPFCNSLQYSGNTNESLKAFATLDNFFSKGEKLDLEPYLLPQKEIMGASESTTKCILHLRYGTRYQMKVEYFEAEELQQQLFELFTMGEDSLDSSAICNTDVKDTAITCLKERYNLLTGCSFSEEAACDTYSEIKLCENVLSFAGKTELYIGKGENVTHDRLALQKVLKSLATAQEDEDEDKDEERGLDVKRKIAALKKIVVYLPSKVLFGGKEILEMPGIDDSDPIAMDFIRNALSEVDGVILVTDFGFTTCEGEVKATLSESGFLRNFQKDPKNTKLMLLAYPEKVSRWQFKQGDIEKIRKLEKEGKNKTKSELDTIKKLLKQTSLSEDQESSIFTSYILPVLYSSILSEKATEISEHEVIQKHSSYLAYTGIQELLMQLDKCVTSKQKSIFERVKVNLKMFEDSFEYILSPEDAFFIPQQLNNEQFISRIKEGIQRLSQNLNTEKIIEDVGAQVESMLMDNVPKAKERWDAVKDKVTLGAYNPHFCGKNPIYKVRLFLIFFNELENREEKIFNNLLDEIQHLLEEYEDAVLHLCTDEFKDYDWYNFIRETLKQLADIPQKYMGNKRRPLNKKIMEKFMLDSQKQNFRNIILVKNFKKCSLDEAKERTEMDMQNCIMEVKEQFMKKLGELLNHRFQLLQNHLWSTKGNSNILKKLGAELKTVSKDRDCLKVQVEMMIKMMATPLDGVTWDH